VTSSSSPGWLAALTRRPRANEASSTEPPFDPTSWGGAIVIMACLGAVLWVVQFANAANDYGFNRFGLRPRQVDGLWGILTSPFLHSGYGHLLSNTAPFVLIGWVLLLSGVRTWVTVTVIVVVVGDLATWVFAPSGVIVGVSGLVFGWLGYLLARAYFSRRLWWIVVAVLVLFFFGTLLGSLLPSLNSQVSWQSHVCGFGAGVLAGAVLHPRRVRRPAQRRNGSAVS
jgi:membrane associated rhomboid family serine protease